MKLQNENLVRRVMHRENYEAFFFDNYYEKDVPLHCHNDFYEVYFFLDGSVEYLLENAQYHMRPGTVLLIPPNTLHQPRFLDKTAPYVRMFLWLSRGYVSALSSPQTDLADCFESPRYKKVAQLDVATIQGMKSAFLKLTELKTSSAWGADLQANAIITEVLLQVHHACMDQPLPAESGSEDFIVRVTSYISENIEDIQTLEQVAEQFYVSKSYLARQFSQKLGISAYQYIIKKRMAQAYELLQQGHPLAEVYPTVGYRDYPTFYKAFRKAYGRGPAALFGGDEPPQSG